MDKKVMRKQLRFVLLDGLGNSAVTSDYDESLLEQVLKAAD
jgi:3-dehydroquinate synthetase